MRKLNQYADVVAGILVILFSASLFVGAGLIQQRAGTGLIGPRTMPQIVAALLAVLGTSLLLSGARKVKTQTHQGGAFPENWNDFLVIVFTFCLLVLYVAVLSTLGFLLATIAYLIVQLSLFEKEWMKRIPHNVAIAVITSACAYFLFRNVFSLMLPAGALF